jgi:hypothetical protein
MQYDVSKEKLDLIVYININKTKYFAFDVRGS